MAKGLLVLLVLLAAAVVFIALTKKRGGKDESSYAKNASLFSAAERSFLGVLDQAIGSQYRVYAKVRVADVLKVEKGLPKAVWQKAFNRISAKHFDYVLCDHGDQRIVCAIELNDKSHAAADRSARDDFLSGACLGAGLPFVQVPVKHGYTVDDLRSVIAAAITPSSPQIAKNQQVS